MTPDDVKKIIKKEIDSIDEASIVNELSKIFDKLDLQISQRIIFYFYLKYCNNMQQITTPQQTDPYVIKNDKIKKYMPDTCTLYGIPTRNLSIK